MISIKVPPLGESIVEAVISRWLKKEGDAVAPGDTLVELETDKVTVEVPTMSGGVIKKRLRAEGETVKLDEVLAEVDETATGAAPAKPVEKQAPAEDAAPKPSPAPAGKTPAQETRVSPAAARVAAERGVDIAGVAGTGRGGVVSKPDVIQASDAPRAPSSAQVARQAPPPLTTRPAPAPVAANGSRETREKMTTRRKRIAEHLLEAQHATAHLTTFNEIDMTAVSALRDRLRERVEKQHGVKLSFMPFFVKASCLALKAYPTVNSQIDGDAIIYKHYVNMGIAVASDAGLVVPNIRDADQLSMVDVGKAIVELANRARAGKLTMDDLTGGTFTITNGGVFGSLVSTPILNYPQVGILGLHKIQERPVAIAGKVEIRPMMYIALSYDHRVVEGQHAVEFLVRVKSLMEDPASMLLE